MNAAVKPFITLLLVGMGLQARPQTKKVLFIGNSYTYVNNLPEMVADIAASAGDLMYCESNAIGGYYLGNHLTNAVTLSKIQAGSWDYVVLQDQSMSYAYANFTNMVPYAVSLDSIIKKHNPCAQTILYMTWGRKNGDTYLCSPPECDSNVWISRTYYEMDSAIQLHYMVTADSIKAGASPVGNVWRFIRRHNALLELYQPDESHPSLAGTYAAACCFYAAIFRKDPMLASFNPGLAASDASLVRTAAKTVVYDSLPNWNIGIYDSLLTDSCQVLGVPSGPGRSLLHVYPNPAHDVLTVECKNASGQTIRFYNVFGAMVKETPASFFTVIDIDDLPAGLYFISPGQGERSFKFVKQ